MTLSLCSVRKLEPRPQKTQILSPQPYCSSPSSDNAHKLDVYIVQQQISLFLDPKVVLCPSMIEEVVPVGCNVLHGGRRGRSLARQPPLLSTHSRVKATVCQHGEQKSASAGEQYYYSTSSSPTQGITITSSLYLRYYCY